MSYSTVPLFSKANLPAGRFIGRAIIRAGGRDVHVRREGVVEEVYEGTNCNYVIVGGYPFRPTEVIKRV